MDEDYNYDEGSDIDNYEDEQVFQDREGDGDDDEETSIRFSEDDLKDDGWIIDYPIHEDSSFLDLSRGCD